MPAHASLSYSVPLLVLFSMLLMMLPSTSGEAVIEMFGAPHHEGCKGCACISCACTVERPECRKCAAEELIAELVVPEADGMCHEVGVRRLHEFVDASYLRPLQYMAVVCKDGLWLNADAPTKTECDRKAADIVNALERGERDARTQLCLPGGSGSYLRFRCDDETVDERKGGAQPRTAAPISDVDSAAKGKAVLQTTDNATQHKARILLWMRSASMPPMWWSCCILVVFLPGGYHTQAGVVETVAPTTASPTAEPTTVPTAAPPTAAPTEAPLAVPTGVPTVAPTAAPTVAPLQTSPPTAVPSATPTSAPTAPISETTAPTSEPTLPPPTPPTPAPTAAPPTPAPTGIPTLSPTPAPPTPSPPTALPTPAPVLITPTSAPTPAPTTRPPPTPMPPTSPPTPAPPTAAPTPAPPVTPADCTALPSDARHLKKSLTSSTGYAGVLCWCFEAPERVQFTTVAAGLTEGSLLEVQGMGGVVGCGTRGDVVEMANTEAEQMCVLLRVAATEGLSEESFELTWRTLPVEDTDDGVSLYVVVAVVCGTLAALVVSLFIIRKLFGQKNAAPTQEQEDPKETTSAPYMPPEEMYEPTDVLLAE